MEDSEEDEEVMETIQHLETTSRKKEARKNQTIGRNTRLASLAENEDISHQIVEALIQFQEKRLHQRKKKSKALAKVWQL